MANRLLTLGHSNRSIDEFIGMLRANGVTAVADVRSQPYSRRYPQFNAEDLKGELRKAGIKYVWLGEELGARRNEAECYDNGQARYERIAKTELFQKGLERIRRGLQTHRIALMCAERDPITCHRMILVCRHLRDECEISHVLEVDTTEPNTESEKRLLEVLGLPDRDLFQTADELIAQAYEKQGRKIAFRADSTAAAAATEDE